MSHLSTAFLKFIWAQKPVMELLVESLGLWAPPPTHQSLSEHLQGEASPRRGPEWSTASSSLLKSAPPRSLHVHSFLSVMVFTTSSYIVDGCFSGSVSTPELLVKSHNTFDCVCCHHFIPEPRTCNLQPHFLHFITHVKAHRQCQSTISYDNGEAWLFYQELDCLWWVTYKPPFLPSLHGK